MNHILFWLLCSLCTLIIFSGLGDRHKIYQYPFFMAAIFASFALPQAFALIYGSHNIDKVPDLAITRLLLMSCFCVAMCWVGYQIKLPPSWLNKPIYQFNKDKLEKITIAYILVGAAFWLLIFNLPDNYGMKLDGTSTGIYTIYVFFARLFANTGFALALINIAKRPKFSGFIILACSSILPVYRAVFFGRRSGLAAILLAIGIVLYLFYRYIPPRLVIISALVLSTILIPLLGQQRGLLSGNWNNLDQIEYTQKFSEVAQGKSALELRNAALTINAVANTSYYGWGTMYWDRLVFRYIPSQLLGRQFKKSLYLSRVNWNGYLRYKYGYHLPKGSTVTGLADSFTQFDYFGCLFFAAIAMLFKWLWYKASVQYSLIAQIMYMNMCVYGMHAITHGTTDFIPNLLYALIAISPIIWFAREKRRSIRV